MPDIDRRLDDDLRATAPWVAFPETPDLAASVVDDLARARNRRARWRPALVAALAATLVLAAAAVAAALGLPGLRFTFVEALPSVQPSALAGSLDLGAPAGLAEARARATFEVVAPADLGAPDEAYVSDGGDIVWLAYAVRPELPALADSDVGLLVTQVDGRVEREQIEKLLLSGVTITPVSVGGAAGFWIEGPPHVLLYSDAGDRQRQLATRLVGDVLVWQAGEVLYRIESALGMDATVRLAQTMRGD